MDSTTSVVLMAGFGTTLTMLMGFWLTFKKKHTEANPTIEHPLTLSLHEQKFRTDLLAEVDEYREKIEALVENLKAVNAELQADNIKLLTKMDHMQDSLDEFYRITGTKTPTEDTPALI